MIFKKFVNHLLLISLIPFFLVFLVTLSGCSPHPGAGNWKADDSNSLNISRINVVYEGTADFYIDGKEKAIRRCFWSAVAENTMQMQCVHGDDFEQKVNYQFIVTEKGHANLLLDEQIIGHFSAQAPEPEAKPEQNK